MATFECDDTWPDALVGTSRSLRCPLCQRDLVVVDVCGACGSLEGVGREEVPTQKRLFGYDWASGLVAPWRSRDGEAYATSETTASAALEAAGLGEDDGAGRTLVVDLGCGDATILRVAATRYGAYGVGYEIDPTALDEAKRAISRDRVDALVELRCEDLTRVDLCAEVARIGATRVVVTAFLLPATLAALRPALREAAARCGATIVTMKWDLGPEWAGARDARGFTVYR